MAIHTWTITSLTAHLVGQLNFDPNAAGGTVPARMTNIVTRAYYDVWEASDWMFRKKLATLTLTASTVAADLAADFAKLDMQWLKENNHEGVLKFTQNVQYFQDRLDLQSDTPGTPCIALLEPDTSDTEKFAWRIRVYPTPDKAYTYPYVYLRTAPDLAVGGVVLWPRPFYRGWELLAHYRVARAFKTDDSWKDIKADYKFWKADAISDKDEAMRADVSDIDSNGDLAALASSNWIGAYY